jgi:hypothetical protein
LNFPSIRIEGAILSPDILDRIEDAHGQRPVDFGLESSAKVKDEILRIWADAQHYWNAFQRKLESLKTDSPATTETRNLWVVPLLTLLGYQLEYQARGAEVNGKNYPVSHRVVNRANTAFHVIGYREPSGLDKKPEKMALRMSAHAMVQGYLNLDDQLYALVTNGRLLRLLRNSSRLVKLSYLEFDLDRIFSDGLFADFAVLFRLLHASRLPQSGAPASSCWLERYHQETIEQGTRIRDGLRDSVTEALEILGTGFLAHPNNAALCQQVKSGELRTDVYFGFLLRLIYRLLFLMVIEERRLVFPAGVDPKKVALYFEHYSVQRLRRLSVTRGLKNERFHDAWLALLSTFQLFESPVRAEKFGTTVLGGQLFNPDSLGPLTKSRLHNAALFGALDRLCYFYHPETKQRMPVNFGALATEEFGSVYESLLELHPIVELEPKPHFGFRQVAGNERKTTGSYYTPTSLVACLLDSALDPVLEERIQNFKVLGFKTVDEAVLGLNVCDPACGSGHFLIAAAQRIARRLAILRASDEEPSLALLRHTLRDVIGSCIHGVDVNPMSVELCKIALWLEAVEPGKPLNFLDHHIKCGNSLLGATPECIQEGIPDKAYEPITGDNKEAAKWMRQLNREAREGQDHFDFTEAMPWERLGNLPAAVAKLEGLDDDTPEALASKEKLYREIIEDSGYESARLLHDTWCAAFVWPKQTRQYGTELTTEHLRKIERNPHSVATGLKVKVQQLAEQYHFFHWHIEFPAVFGPAGKSGFDVTLGNPPWERIQLEKKEFFATRSVLIAEASSKKRDAYLRDLEISNPDLFKEWQNALAYDAGCTHLIKDSGLFPLSSKGNLNTFALFTELCARTARRNGNVGLLVPSGLITEASHQHLFRSLMQSQRLALVLDFENNENLFPNVHRSYRFSLITLVGRKQAKTCFSFFLREPKDATDPERKILLDYQDIAQINPNSITCPPVSSRSDMALLLKAHRRAGIFVSEDSSTSTSGNPWLADSKQMLNATHDRDCFFLADQTFQLDEMCATRVDKDGTSLIRLYEGKMIQQFDHRLSSYVNRSLDSTESETTNDAQHCDPNFIAVPRYWVPLSKVKSLVPQQNRGWILTFRAVTRATDRRTAIASFVPFVGLVHAVPALYSPLSAACQSALIANLNSFFLDYCARLKFSGPHFSHFLLRQLPLLPPTTYDANCEWARGALIAPHATLTLRDWLLPRVLELTYTAWDLEAFARDCAWSGPPFHWDEERRFLLRCELDAAFFNLYLPATSEGGWKPALRAEGAVHDETPEQLAELTKHFPRPRDAVAYIMDTFPIVKRKDEEKYNGDYRTKRVILEIYDAMQESIRTGQPYQTRLRPPPGPPTDEHGHFIPMSQWDPNHWPSHIHPPRK